MSWLLDDLRETFREGSMTIRLIYINLAIYLLIVLNGFLAHTLGWINILDYMWMPTQLGEVIFRPWTIITYMFTHQGFIHVLFNMMCLYWFGKMVSAYMGEHLVLRLYLTGGIAGAVACLLYGVLVNPINGYMLGASAAVLALVTAVATYYPDHYVEVVFIGRVKLKYYALFFVVMYLVFILDGSSNLGGNVAHVGGMIAGFAMAYSWKKNGLPTMKQGGKSVLDGLFGKKKTKMKVVYSRPLTDMEYNERKNERNREVDRILDKIKESGYDSLTSEEKKTLFEESKR